MDKKKVFYFNLNDAHIAAEKLFTSINSDISEWQKSTNSINLGIHYSLIEFTDFSSYMSAHETGKPFFDYYRDHGEFNLDEIEKLYSDIGIKINRDRFKLIIQTLDQDIQLIKDQRPDVILIRFYAYYEFLLLYILDKIKDVPAFKSIGGADPRSNNWYYIDYFLENGLLNNYHDGYGEKHVRKILETPENIPQKTYNYVYDADTASMPTDNIHWIINTILCSGTCKFCIHNRDARKWIKSNANFTSDEYVDFITDRLKLFQDHGVNKVFVPGSVTFYNTAHIKKFHAAYMKKNLHIQFIDTFFKMDDLTAEIFPLLKDMNFHAIKVGLESSTERIREKAGKLYKNDIVINAIKLFNEYDIYFKFLFIWNFPFTNQDDLRRDIEFIKKYNIGYPAPSQFELFNDTHMEIHPEEYNLTKFQNEHGYIYYRRTGIEFNTEEFKKLVEEFLYITTKSPERRAYKKKYFSDYFNVEKFTGVSTK